MDTADDTITLTGATPPGSRGALSVHPVLYLLFQADDLAAGSTRHVLAELDEIDIGRGGERTIMYRTGASSLKLSCADRRMSSRHCRIRRGPRRTWLIEDLGSKNGTNVNGRPVPSETVLRDGDLIEAGSTFLLFRGAVPVAELDAKHVASSNMAAAASGAPRTMIPWLAHQYADLARVVLTDTPIALLGETGTGKEVVARALHQQARRRGPFVAVNCGAIPGGLVESELFGHKRGAFSRASSDRTGLVQSAHDGTLFLDEVGELPPPAQTALLRVLQEREVLPVGARRPEKVDVGVITATNRSMETLVQRGEFREDLWARLAGYVARLPALRERREDLGLILFDLLERIVPGRSATLSLHRDAARAIIQYPWPRNVRELVMCMQAAMALCDGDIIELGHLSEAVRPSAGAMPRQPPPAREAAPSGARHDRRRQELIAQLRAHRGNVTAVAEAMGYARQVVHRWLKAYGIDADDYR
jgi:DNA-binding NtrC family response regulator